MAKFDTPNVVAKPVRGKKINRKVLAGKKIKTLPAEASAGGKKTKIKPLGGKKTRSVPVSFALEPVLPPHSPLALGPSAAVLDRLWSVIEGRRDTDPNVSHSARLLSRGTAKVAQKFGEEAVECLIEATAGNRTGLISESADVLYHLIVMWVNAGIRPDEVWAELKRREGISGIAEKASRAKTLPIALGVGTTKIP